MNWKSRINAVRHNLSQLRYPLLRILDRRKNTKVKLVAIAKNEAAYIPEWVYHHLYFGVDSIEIHFNGCTDNTEELQSLFPTEQVKFICADTLFEQAKKGPQGTIYRNAFKVAHSEGFTHLLLLDLDEFWTPLDCQTTIKTLISSTENFDVMSFPWRNKVNETLFELPIKEKTVVETAQQVKSLYRTYLQPISMNPHNITDNGLKRLFEDGTEFPVFDSVFAKVPQGTKLARAFIVHRKFRSELEYVAMLGRGRPVGLDRVQSQFKNNRHGFEDDRVKEHINFPSDAFNKYHAYMQERMANAQVAQALDKARQHVNTRYQRVICDIASAPQEEATTLARLLKRVSIPEVLSAYNSFKEKHAQK